MHTGTAALPMRAAERRRPSIHFVAGQGGVRLACTAVGSGLPLVKTAAWMGHIELETDNPVWQPLHDALSQRHQLLRHDTRGTGLSDRDVADLCLERWVDDLEHVVDAQGLRRFALLGLS